MDRLPSDIIAKIVEHLRPEDHSGPWYLGAEYLPIFIRYMDLSLQWREAVERRVFRRIDLDDLYLKQFAAIFAEAHRIPYLQELSMLVWLGAHSEEGPREHEENAVQFSNSVHWLFTTLARHTGPPSGLRFALLARPMIIGHCPANPVWRYITMAPPHYSGTLPKVQCITELDNIQVDGRVRIRPATVCQILSALPNLRTLTLKLDQPSRRVRGLRRRHRLALADGLRSLQLPGLQTLRLSLGDSDPKNHSFISENFEDGDGVDPLSDALRVFTQSCPLLKEVALSDGQFSPALFRDPQQQHLQHPNHLGTWPALESLVVNMRGNLVAPNGTWYFTGERQDVEEQQPREMTPEFREYKWLAWAMVNGITRYLGIPTPARLPRFLPAPLRYYQLPRWVPTGDPDDDGETNLGYGHGFDTVEEFDAFVGDFPRHAWRTRPDPSTFDPLVRSLAEAVSGWGSMPKLRSMRFVVAPADREPEPYDPERRSFPLGGIRIDFRDDPGVASGLDDGEVADHPLPPVTKERRQEADDDDGASVRRCDIWLDPGIEWDVPGYVANLFEKRVGDGGAMQVHRGSVQGETKEKVQERASI
ncbi:hypothetical protein QBC44DRAFT_306531 [Cladorrhinum sp. PSN332]|nr:hypothetical protein QBC44DRAFT_306531 [Cladorrhinum sp. PSN332]